MHAVLFLAGVLAPPPLLLLLLRCQEPIRKGRRKTWWLGVR
jgi:hypothetical protein